MRLRSKEDAEIFIVEALLKCLGEKEPWVEPGPDPPDAVARFGGHAVGIEVTEFHDDAEPSRTGGSPKMEEQREFNFFKHWFHLGRMARPELDYIYGHVVFRKMKEGRWASKRGLPSKEENPLFVKQLLGFAVRQLTCLTTEETSFREYGSDLPLVDKYLEKLTLQRVSFYSMDWDYDCHQNQGLIGGVIQEGELLAILKAKKAAMGSVRGNADKEWLFAELWLVVSASAISSPFMFGLNVTLLQGFRQLNEELADFPCDTFILYNYYFGQVLRWNRSLGWVEVCKRKMATKKRKG